ncbi:MAG: ATP-binding cassette domain-containing protein [Puniceicoccales bacterium]|jgi:ABC-type lipoprotein export system ATPase subunit|nr:ATP-binding cassette domain-containing protein [Puniceicoccales bacterium]
MKMRTAKRLFCDAARLVRRSIAHRWRQSLAAMLVTALGAALLLAFALLRDGAENALEAGRRRLGADLLVLPGNAVGVDAERVLFAGAPLNVYMPEALATSAATLPGVVHVERQFFTQTLKLSCCSGGSEIRLVGVEPKSLRRMAGDGAEAGKVDAVSFAVLGNKVLQGVAAAGARVELLGRVFTVSQRLGETGTSLDFSILLPLDTARTLAANSPALAQCWRDAGAPPAQLVSALLLEAAPGTDLDALARAAAKLGDVRVFRADSVFAKTKKLLDATLLVLALVGSAAALAGAAAFVAQFAASIAEREGEWALYRAVGATHRHVLAIIVGEALTLAAAGALAGVLIGIVLHQAAAVIFHNARVLPLETSLGATAFAAAAVVALYAAAGALAALPAALRIVSKKESPRSNNAPTPSLAASSARPSPSTTLLLGASNISFSYHADGAAVDVLGSVSLELRANESVALTGVSGGGKTTLLNILGLLHAPDGGVVSIRETDAPRTDVERAALRSRVVGYVFQSSQLAPALSARENVLLPAWLAANLAPADYDAAIARADALLAVLGLTERATHLPHQLSFGQRRRVAIARAVLLRPAVLLADEPSNDLDPATAAIVTDFLFAQVSANTAVLIATHDTQLAARASRRLRLEDGRLTADAVTELR